jgi:hypothetical protein
VDDNFALLSLFKIQKTMFHVTMDAVAIQNENLLKLENKIKSLMSRIEPSIPMNFNMQESYQQVSFIIMSRFQINMY